MKYLDKAYLYEMMSMNRLEQLMIQSSVSSMIGFKSLNHTIERSIRKLRSDLNELQEALFIHNSLLDVDDASINDVIEKTNKIEMTLYNIDADINDTINP